MREQPWLDLSVLVGRRLLTDFDSLHKLSSFVLKKDVGASNAYGFEGSHPSVPLVCPLLLASAAFLCLQSLQLQNSGRRAMARP